MLMFLILLCAFMLGRVLLNLLICFIEWRFDPLLDLLHKIQKATNKEIKITIILFIYITCIIYNLLLIKH